MSRVQFYIFCFTQMIKSLMFFSVIFFLFLFFSISRSRCRKSLLINMKYPKLLPPNIETRVGHNHNKSQNIFNFSFVIAVSMASSSPSYKSFEANRESITSPCILCKQIKLNALSVLFFFFYDIFSLSLVLFFSLYRFPCIFIADFVHAFTILMRALAIG